MTEFLVEVESAELLLHEKTIEQGLKTFVDVGNALLAIRDKRLYRQDFGTFEDYCQERWGMERRHAYRLMDAAQAVENVSLGTQILPTSERQARPLTRLEPELQATAWQRSVATAPNGKVTAAHVEATVRTFVTPLPQSAVVSQRVSEVVSTEVRFVPAVAPEEDDEGYDWAQDEPLSVVIAPPARSPEWTSSQMGRKARVEFGFTVHANMKTDLALIEWAKQNGLFVRVDRATEWGNPFHLPGDGDRDTVLDNYEWYLERKPSLLTKISTLKGKVLGCWCYPELCHAGILEERANGEN